MESVLVKDLAVANALRRVILQDLTGVAPTSVKFLSNTSLMSEEMIAFSLAWCAMKSEQPKGKFVFKQSNKDSKGYRSVRCLHAESDAATFVDPQLPLLKLAPGESVHAEVDYAPGLGRDHCKFCRATRVACKPADGKVNLEVQLVDPDDSNVTAQAISTLFSMINSVTNSAPDWQDTSWTWQTAGATCCALLQEMAGRLLPVANTAILTSEEATLRCTSQKQEYLRQAQQAVTAACAEITQSLDSLKIRRSENSQF